LIIYSLPWTPPHDFGAKSIVMPIWESWI
jgi:hypothetical protein